MNTSTVLLSGCIILALSACGGEAQDTPIDTPTDTTSASDTNAVTSLDSTSEEDPSQVDVAVSDVEAGGDDAGAEGDASIPGPTVVPEGCCVTDADCDTGRICVGESDDSPGQCAQEPWGGSCYQETCPNLHLCLGSQTCACGEDCDIRMGYNCMPVEGDCCEDDAGCPADGVCREGTCVVAPGPMECWGDSDCAAGEACQGASICGCLADCAWETQSRGYCVTEGEDALSECVSTYTNCGCPYSDMQCLDGWSIQYWYPESAGEFPGSTSVPAEVKDVAVAFYECAYCSCQENWQVRVPVEEGAEDTDLVDTDPVSFCVRLLEEQAQCSGCIVEWFGGAG